MDRNEEEALKYAAELQSIMDYLTPRVYGDGATFQRLSAFGQAKIEEMARAIMEPPPAFGTGKSALAEAYADTLNRLSSALRRIEELEDDNNSLQMELEEYESSNNRTPRNRETASRDLIERILRQNEPKAPPTSGEGDGL